LFRHTSVDVGLREGQKAERGDEQECVLDVDPEAEMQHASADHVEEAVRRLLAVADLGGGTEEGSKHGPGYLVYKPIPRPTRLLVSEEDPGIRTVTHAIYALDMWKRWYHVLVEAPDGKQHRIAIETTSAIEARQLIAADWGDKSIREVKTVR
jgi:hypothetical protein